MHSVKMSESGSWAVGLALSMGLCAASAACDSDSAGRADPSDEASDCSPSDPAPGCFTCELDGPVGLARCEAGIWRCDRGAREISCDDEDYPDCSSYGGEVCCDSQGNATPALCPSPSQAYCPDGSAPQARCGPCGDGEGYIAEDGRCVACDSHDDPNPHDACAFGFDWRAAAGCDDSGTSWYRCTPCQELGPITPGALAEAKIGAPYEVLFSLDGIGSEPPATWGGFSVEGPLPAGISLDGARLAGVPSESGDFAVTVRFVFDIEDAELCPAPLERALVLSVAP